MDLIKLLLLTINNLSFYNITKNITTIILVGTLSILMTSTNSNTTDSSLHNLNQRHQYQRNYLAPRHVITRNAPNQANQQVALPIASRIAPAINEHLQRPPVIVRQKLAPTVTVSQPEATRSPVPSSVATSFAAPIPTKQRNDVFSKAYRGARDTLGSLINTTSSLPLGNMAVMLFAGLFLASPFVMPEIKRSIAGVTNFEERFIQGRLESFVSWIERSVEDLPAFPRLHPQECVKRAVCEVNHDSKKYGLPGLILQVMFPPHMETEEPSRVVNKYKMAASYGKFNTSNDPEGCKTKYEECIVNLLDIVQNLMGLFLN